MNSLFLAVLGLHCCVGFFLVVVSGGYSLVAMHGFSLWWLLLLWSSGSKANGLQWLRHIGSAVVVPGL